jgi:hypothetical protein
MTSSDSAQIDFVPNPQAQIKGEVAIGGIVKRRDGRRMTNRDAETALAAMIERLTELGYMFQGRFGVKALAQTQLDAQSDGD